MKREMDATPMSLDEYHSLEPVLAMHRRGDGDVVVGINIEAFDSPALWGTVIADIVKNVASAYEQEGMSGKAVYESVRDALYEELEVPTAKAERLRLVEA